MKITDVKVFPVEEDKLKAYATITLDNCFIVRDLKIIAGTKGFFIAMPSKKRKDGTFRDIAHPLNSETRSLIEQAVIEVFNRGHAAGEPAATVDSCGPADPGPPPIGPRAGEATVETPAPASAIVPEEDPPTKPSGDTPPARTSGDTPPARTSGDSAAQRPGRDMEPATGIPEVRQPDDPARAFGYEEE
jgi:stage V sporulation protein G